MDGKPGDLIDQRAAEKEAEHAWHPSPAFGEVVNVMHESHESPQGRGDPIMGVTPLSVRG